jgi:hypothetical protein
LFLRFDKDIGDLSEAIYAGRFFNFVEGLFYEFHMLFILVDHFDFVFVGFDKFFESVFEEVLGINGRGFVYFL